MDIIRNSALTWHFDVDASFVKNEIVKLPYGHSMPSQGLFIGKSLYQHYTYDWAGVDTQTGNSLYYMLPDSPDLWLWNENGDRNYEEEQKTWNDMVASAKASGHYFEDENGNPMTDRTEFAYRRDMGSGLPVVYGSFGTQLSWKGINFSMLFTYGLGGKTYNSNYQRLMMFSQSSAGALHKDILDAWNGTPVARTADANGVKLVNSSEIDANGIPVRNTVMSQYNDASSSRFLISSSYLTLKNINISYDLPRKWMNAIRLQGINIGLSVDNVFIASKQKGMNPTYGFGGAQGAYYVPSRVLSFQLTAKF